MAKAKALPKPARRAAKPAQTLKPTQEEEPLPPPPYELTRSPSSAVYGLSVGGILSTVVNVLVLGCALFAVVRAPAGREFLARADISMRWSTVSLGVRDGHDFSWRRPAQLAVRAALTATIGLPIAIACGGDPLAHLETYARAAEGDVYPFRDGIAISSHAIITEIVGGADQPRRPMVLAHPLLVADPIARECMRRDTLIFLATGATHSAVRRAVHQAVPGFSWSGPSPELLVAGNNASGCAGEQGGGVCPEGSVGGSCEQGEQGGAGCPAGSARAFLAAAAGEPIDANKVRELVLVNLFSRMMGAPPDQSTLAGMLSYYSLLPLCLLGVGKESTRLAREATAAGVRTSPAGARVLAISEEEGLDGGMLATQLADGLLFAGGYGTSHLALHTIERIRAAPASMVPLWRRDPVAFLHESARLDPPVLSVAALAPRDGFAVRTAGRGTLNLAEGVPMQLMLTHANRDPAVFFRPDVFDPGRPHLEKVLSWNGLLGQVKAGLTPRGCPGYALSLDVARLLVEAALPGEHEAASPPLASANQLDAEATLVGVAHMRGRSEGRSEEPGASPTAILQFAYIFWGLSCMVAGTVLPTLLRSYGGPATSCVAIFCNAQQASTLGWLAQTQTLKVADVYLPGSSGLVRVKHVLSLLEYVGVCGSAGAWLRLWLTLKHAALDSPPSVSLSESSASLRLCVRVFCVCLVLYVTLGVEVPTGNYMLVCLAVYLPAGLLSLGATFVFWRDHGKKPIVLLGALSAWIFIVDVICDALGARRGVDILFADIDAGVSGLVSSKWHETVAYLLVSALPLLNLFLMFSSAREMDKSLGETRDYAYPSRTSLNKALKAKQLVPLCLLMLALLGHKALVPLFTPDLARCWGEGRELAQHAERVAACRAEEAEGGQPPLGLSSDVSLWRAEPSTSPSSIASALALSLSFPAFPSGPAFISVPASTPATPEAQEPLALPLLLFRPEPQQPLPPFPPLPPPSPLSPRGCAYDPTPQLESHTRLYFTLIQMLADSVVPNSLYIHPPVETGAGPLPSLEVFPGLRVPTYDEDESLDVASSLANQAFDGYVQSSLFHPLQDSQLGWRPPAAPRPLGPWWPADAAELSASGGGGGGVGRGVNGTETEMSAAAADAIDAEDRSIDADVSALMRRLSNGMLPTPLYDYEKVMGGPHPLLTDAALAHMAFGGIGAHLPRRARAVADSVAGPCAVGKVPRRAAFELDMGWMCPLTVRPSFERYGAVVFFDAVQRPLAIWWHHGRQLVRPGEPLWAHAKWAWRSSLMSGVTLKDHLTVVHLVLGNALVTAAREQLSAAHPLRRLLKPFTYRTVAVNRGARNLLCQELSLLHRTVALDAAGLHAAFNASIAAAHEKVDLLSETLIDADEPPLDAGSARTPFAADHLAFRAVVHRFVQAYVCEYYSSDQVLLDDAQVRQMWAALRHRFRRLPRLTEGGQVLEGAWPLRRARARTPRETLVQVLTSLLVHVTAVHKHVGPAGEYVSDPRYAGSKIRAGVEVADVQASVQVLSIALVTGFRQPMLMDDYTHVLLRDAHLAATRRIFDGFQAELAALSLEVRRKNARRLFRVQSFDPARLSSSVSI